MKITTVINDELYKLVESKLSNSATEKKFMANIAKFMNSRSKQLNDVAPYTNIYFNSSDVSGIFNSIGLAEKDVEDILKKCFFWNQDYRPKCAKEPYVEVLACAIRYYLKNNNTKSAKIVTVYLCFSGKFYASIYSHCWKYPAKDTIMDYVVNNMLNDKFDLRKEGTILKSIDKLATTYITKYESDFKSDMDDDEYAKKIIQQLRDRVKSFLMNIFAMYKYAADNKLYMNYETDSLDPDAFRITDNDSATAARLTEAAVGIMTSQRVDVGICNKVQNPKEQVRSDKIKNILESIILVDSSNIPSLKRVINILICSFYGERKNKNATTNSVDFIEYCAKPKPNTKNPLLLEMKQTIIGWLNQDATYRQCNRDATLNAYYKAIVLYFAFIIQRVSN